MTSLFGFTTSANMERLSAYRLEKHIKNSFRCKKDRGLKGHNTWKLLIWRDRKSLLSLKGALPVLQDSSKWTETICLVLLIIPVLKYIIACVYFLNDGHGTPFSPFFSVCIFCTILNAGKHFSQDLLFRFQQKLAQICNMMFSTLL